MAEDSVEYWQEDDISSPSEGIVAPGPWHWHIKFANGRIAGHEYDSRGSAVEGFHAANAAVFGIMQKLVRQVNEDNGWFETDRTFGDEVALLHSEVSEALEEFRSGNTGRMYKSNDLAKPTPLEDGQKYPQGKKPIGVPSEMADILVRLLDVCDRYKIDLYNEWLAKVQYNATRGHRHGNKAL